MEQDWITSTVYPKRLEFAQKHGVSDGTVKKYYGQGDWKIKRLAYWQNLTQTVDNVSKVALAQASKHLGTHSAADHQRDESVEQSVEVVGRVVAETVNQREDETTKLMSFVKDALTHSFRGILMGKNRPLIITSATPQSAVDEVRGMIDAMPITDRYKMLPALAKAIVEIQRIQEVMQGRPDSMTEIVGIPQNLTLEEEAAIEIVHAISLRGEGSND